MEKDDALSSRTTGVEHPENIDAKDTAEILVGQLERGFDDRDASILKSKEASTNEKPKEHTHGDDTGDVALKFDIDPLECLLQFVGVAHVALVGLTRENAPSKKKQPSIECGNIPGRGRWGTRPESPWRCPGRSWTSCTVAADSTKSETKDVESVRTYL